MRLILLLPLLIFSSCAYESQMEAVTEAPPSLDSLFDAYSTQRLEFNPVEATAMGISGYNDTLVNYISDSNLRKLLDFYTRYEDALSKVDSANLTPDEVLFRDVMAWDIAIKKEGLTNEIVQVTSPLFGMPTMELLPINQILSFHLYVAQIGGGGNIQPFETVEDYRNWLSRLEDYVVYLETVQEKMQEGVDKGFVYPSILTTRMIAQLEPMINTPVEDHVFYAPVTMMSEEFSDVDSEDLRAKYASFINKKLIPQFVALQTFLRETYLPAAPGTSGIGGLPGGKAAYEYLVRFHTTTNMTADEIFDLGEREVARISSEMEKVKNEIGFEGSLKEFFDHVRTNPDLMSYETPEEVIEHFREIHDRMKPQLKLLFDLTPKGEFEIRRTEAFREASASAEYQAGAKDGSRPGIFYVPIPDVKAYNDFSDESLFLHEAIPGHHYQLSLQQENDDLPAFMHGEGMGVFVEGWALYSESLGSELGLYKDPYQYFGMLSAEMHRAIRLVVDVGLHARGWSREEAIQYSLDHEAESEASVIAEIERYMAVPGQALSYKIGQLKILELRERARQQLGDAFDIREFHNQVLNTGSLPLVLLEKKIDRWIASQSADAQG